MSKTVSRLLVLIVVLSMLLSVFAVTGMGAAKKVTLTVMANQDWVTKPYMKAAWKAYEEATGNKLDIQAVPIDSGETVMKTKFATGEITDIFMHFGGYGLTPYRPDKNFVDFSRASWVRNIYDFVLPQAKYNGKVYGIPFWEASISGMIYNKEILDKLGLSVPKTSDEFIAVCEKIKAAGITPIYLAFKDVWPLLYQFAMDSIVKDPKVLEKLNTNQIKYADIKEFNDMLKWYKMLADKKYLGERFSANTWDGGPAAMGEGKYAMMYVWDSWVSSDLEPKYPNISKKFGMLPAFLGVNKEGNYEGPNVCVTFVNKNSKNVKEATNFVSFLAKAATINLAFKDYGTAPVFKNETSNKLTDQYLDAKDSILKLTLPSTAWPSLIGFTQVEGAKPIQDLMLGTFTVEQAAKAIDDERIKIAKAQQIPGF